MLGNNCYALLVGCEYQNTKEYLPGTLYDIECVHDYLLKNNVPENNITLMTDETDKYPTKNNLLHAKFLLLKLS